MKKWIRILLDNYKASINHCGNASAPFVVGRGCRQGDPIAMLLYIVYVEPLLITLEVKMAGLRIRNHQSLGLNPTLDFDQKCEAFCDDVNLMTGDLNDLPIIESVVDKFERSSGAILSRNHKCKKC